MPRTALCSLALVALLSALGGCSAKKTPGAAEESAIPTPVVLSAAASRPAGTLDSLPELSWTLQGGEGRALVVRAQGPGGAAPGVGFAGVPVASGPVRYLAADGTWSETEVTYAPAPAATGIILPTAPLRLEGDWRFDLMAKGAAGELQAMAMVSVLLTAQPSVRVALAQRFAAPGDVVEGRVVLARGAAARGVKLLAWWQGPGGVAYRLPEGAELAFDGDSADVSLPLLARRLDGAAPGTWSLVARLFDAATGAPLAYGEQSLEVCGAAPPAVAGTVRDAVGAPLGAGASRAEVRALSLDRQVQLAAPVDSAGAFTLDLQPGAWAVSARVEDGAGLHEVPPQLVQVGCAAAPPLALQAEPAVAWPASGRSARPARPAAARIAPRAATPAPPLEQVQVPMFGASSEGADKIIGKGALAALMTVVSGELSTAVSNGFAVNPPSMLAGVARVAALQQGLGTDSTHVDRLLYEMVGGHVLSAMTASRVSPTEVLLTLSFVDGKDGTVFRSVQRTTTAEGLLAAGDALVAEAVGGSPSLLDEVRRRADLPQNPNLSIVSSFGSVTPQSQHAVKVHLASNQGNTYAGRLIYLERSPLPFPADVSATTDAAGDATFQVTLGAHAPTETLRATYFSRAGKPSRSERLEYAVQPAQTGTLRHRAVVPVVRPGADVVLEVTSTDAATGAPQAATPVAFTGNLGGVAQTASAITDAAGVASATVQAGTAVGLAQVTAVASAAVPPPADAPRATENLVVSSPVAINLAGPSGSVLPGAQVPITGTIHLDGIPLAGATLTFASTGTGGALSSSTATADPTGAFTVTFQPPASGAGAATISAAITVEGQPVVQAVDVGWATAGRKIAFGCQSAGSYNYDLCVVNPDGTGLVHLTQGFDTLDAAWSPDDSRIAFACNRGASTGFGICTVNADGTGLADVRPGMTEPTWSPDGTQIAARPTASWSFATFNVAEASGYTSVALPTGLCFIHSPSWSSRGVIAFVGWTDCSLTSQGSSIYSMNPDGSGLRLLTGVSGYGNPSWSPDGWRIAFTRSDSGSASDSVWVMAADGTGQRRLGEGREPTWSPDGSQIAFYKHYLLAVGPFGIWVMNADGSSPSYIAAGIGPGW